MTVSMETLLPFRLSDGIPVVDPFLDKPSLNPSLKSVSDAVGVALLSLFSDALRYASPVVSSSCVRGLFSFLLKYDATSFELFLLASPISIYNLYWEWMETEILVKFSFGRLRTKLPVQGIYWL